MSQENVELVRWAFEELHARRTVDVPGVEERIDPDYLFRGRSTFPGRTVYRLNEMPALWADLDETYTDHFLVPTHYEDLGDQVLVTLEQTARLRGSNQEINQTIYMVWFVVGGKLRETRTFGDKAEALESAGLSG